MRRAAAIAAVFIAGCTSLAPQAEKVRVTSDGSEVANCTTLGTVTSQPPYVGPDDGVKQLRNNAAALGADTLLLTSSGAMRGQTGMAYRCAAQPMSR
jgi:hypothetical protein